MAKPDVELTLAASLEDFVRGLNQATSTLSGSLSEMHGETQRGTSRINRAFQKSRSSIARSLGGIRKSLFNVRSAAIAAAGAIGAFAAGRALKNFFTSSLGLARDFQQQMAAIKAVSGATQQEFEALQESARKAGETTIFTAVQAAQGLEDLARAGQSATEAIATLPNVLNLAQAEAIEVSEAAQLVSTTLNQFRLAAEESGRVADILSRTSQISSQRVSELAKALEEAGPAAKLSGLSLEETAGIIGGLADVGIRASKAGTALRNALSQLQDPGSKFSQELEKLGIQSDNLVEIFEELGRAGAPAERAFIALGIEAGPKLRTLLNEGRAGFTELIAELQRAEGTAQRTADTMNNTFQGALLNLQSAWDSLKESLLSPLLEPLTEQVKALTVSLREFAQSPAFAALKTDLVEGFKNAAAAVREFLEEFDFEEATKRLGQFVSDAGAHIETLIGAAQQLASIVRGISASVRIVANAVDVAVSTIVGSLAFMAKKMAEAFNQLPAFARGFRDFSNEVQFFADVQKRAFDRAARNSGELKQAFSDLATVFTGTSEEAQKAAANTRDAGRAAEEAASQVDQATEAFDRMARKIREATSAEEIEALRLNLEHLRDSGRITGREYELAIGTIIRRLDELGKASGETARKVEGEAQGAMESIRDLGFSISRQLEADAERARKQFEKIFADSEKTLGQKQQAFLDYAKAAIEANNGVISSELRLQAATLGVEESVERLKERYEELQKQLKGLGDEDPYEPLKNGANDGKEALEGLNEEAKKTPDRFEEAQKAAKGAGQQIAGLITQWTNLGGTVADSMNAIVRSITTRGESVMSFLHDLGRASRDLAEAFNRDAAEADKVINAFESGAKSAMELRSAAIAASSSVQVLDQQRLDKLQEIIQQARQEMEEFRHTVADVLADSERRLLEFQGKRRELAIRESQDRIDELEALLKKAPPLSDERSKIQQAIENERTLLDLRLKKIDQEQRAQKQRESDAQGFHQSEMRRIDQQAQARTSGVQVFDDLDRSAEDFHQKEMDRIEKENDARRKGVEDFRKEMDGVIAGAGGLLKGGRIQQEHSINLKVLPVDRPGLPTLNLSDGQLQEVANRIMDLIRRSRGINIFGS